MKWLAWNHTASCQVGCNIWCCFSPLRLSPTWKTAAHTAFARSPYSEMLSAMSCELWFGWTRVLALQPSQTHSSDFIWTWVPHRKEWEDVTGKDGFSSISSPQPFHEERSRQQRVVPARPQPSRITPAWRPQSESCWAGGMLSHTPTMTFLPIKAERVREASWWQTWILLQERIPCPAVECAVWWQPPVGFLRDRNLSFPGRHLPITEQEGGWGARPFPLCAGLLYCHLCCRAPCRAGRASVGSALCLMLPLPNAASSPFPFTDVTRYLHPRELNLWKGSSSLIYVLT